MKFFFETKDYNRKYSNLVFEYYFCKECKTISLKNIPRKKEYLYQDNYYSTKSKIAILKDNMNRILYLRKINLKKKSNIFEIGSGYGEFLYCAKKEGFNPTGFDINPKLNKYTMKNYKIKTITKKNISQVKKKYDLIVSWHSLEHFKNPFSTLKALDKLCKKNSYIILSLPNIRAFGFKLLKEKWPHIDAPRHINLIDFETIIKIFEKKNYELIDIKTNDDDSKYNNRLSYAIFFSNFFNNKSFFNLNKFMKYIFQLLGIIARIIFIPLEERKLNGSSYNIILKKK